MNNTMVNPMKTLKQKLKDVEDEIIEDIDPASEYENVGDEK